MPKVASVSTSCALLGRLLHVGRLLHDDHSVGTLVRRLTPPYHDNLTGVHWGMCALPTLATKWENNQSMNHSRRLGK